MNDIDWEQVKKDEEEATHQELMSAYDTIEFLVKSVKDQDAIILRLKDRLLANNIPVLEKSIAELSREELVKLNKAIPDSRFNRVDNPEKLKMPSTIEQIKHGYEQADSRQKDILKVLREHITEGVDLDKHGIDPETLTFKEGFGPNGKVETVKVKKTWVKRAMEFLGL